MKHPVLTMSSTLFFAAASVQAVDTPPGPPAPAPAGAADPFEVLKKRIEALEKEVKKEHDNAVTTDDVQGVNNTIQTFLYQYQRDRDTGQTTTALRQLQIGGTVQLRAEAESKAYNAGIPGTATSVATTPTQVSNNAPIVDGRKTTFDIDQATIFFQGNLFRDYGEGRNLTFRVAANSSAGVNPAAENGANTGPLNLTDAYLTYNFLPTVDPAGDTISATFGQQLLPFGLEAQADESLRPVIVSAQFSSLPGIGVREIGLIFRGAHDIEYDYGYNYGSSLFAWALGIVNGSGPNRADDNNYKDQLGRVEFKIPTDYNSWLRELRIGASFYHGRQNLTGATPATEVIAGAPIEPVSTPSQNFYVGEGEKSRYGFDIYYNHNPIGLTYEFVILRDALIYNNNSTGANPTGNPGIAPTSIATSAKYVRVGDSHTLTVFYNVGEQFLSNARLQGRFDDWWPKTYQYFFRYDRLDTDIRISNNQTDIYTLGFNLFFAQTTKLQLNLNHKVYHQGVWGNASPKGSIVENEALLQFQYGF
jgi:hypothetical protein